MQQLIDKITSYNLFNYLFPGVVFAAVGYQITGVDLTGGNLAVGAFICYLYGLIISRIGSLLVEPILKKVAIIRLADYQRYIAASKKDPLIETLSEQNNSYRTLIALFLVLLCLHGLELMRNAMNQSWDAFLPYVLLSLMAMFVAAYSKQTNYIRKRIDKCLEDDSNTKSQGNANEIHNT